MPHTRKKLPTPKSRVLDAVLPFVVFGAVCSICIYGTYTYCQHHITYGPISGNACLNTTDPKMQICLDHNGQWSYSDDTTDGKVVLHLADGQKEL
jgi:hypothetical protein